LSCYSAAPRSVAGLSGTPAAALGLPSDKIAYRVERRGSRGKTISGQAISVCGDTQMLG
jgi:hypothetical protein